MTDPVLAAASAPLPSPVLAQLFPSWVAGGLAERGQLAHEGAHPDELVLLSAGAIQRRRDDFSLGRIAARRALEALGVPPQPVGVGPDRSPRWPEGLVGAISHSGGRAAAVVAHESRTAGLGLDVEGVRQLREDVASMIADRTETTWIDGDPLRLLSLFSAKEAVYKAFYRFHGAYFGFDAVSLRWHGAGFHAVLQQPLGRWPQGYAFEVGCVQEPERVWTAVCLPAIAA